jgi:hypothetical protein
MGSQLKDLKQESALISLFLGGHSTGIVENE